MKNIKFKLLQLMQLLGIFHVFRWWNRNKIIILYAHGVVDPDDDSAWCPLRSSLSAEVFSRQVAFLSKYYSWVPLDAAIDMIEGERPLQPYTIAITFDDGYVNNMSVALPILAKHNIVPTFYVPTGFINSRKQFWFDRLDYAIQQITELYRIELNGESFEFLPGDRENQKVEYSRLRNLAKEVFESDGEFVKFFGLHSSQIEELTGASLSDIQQTDMWSAIMSEEDIQSLSTDGAATIGSHTVDHIRLDKVNLDDCSYQLKKSKADLEEIIDRQCDHFCYPNGNVNAAVVESVQANGYRSAVTTASGFNCVGSDVFQLNRVHLPSTADAARLAAQLSGFDFALDRMRTRLRGR